jgi:Fur family ferric uptake transcriptional regulator
MRRNLSKRKPGQTQREAFVGGFRSYLHGSLRRVTGVREALVRAALSQPGHFHPEDLVAALQRQGVPISRATVYRALPLLIGAGIIEPTGEQGGRQLYEAAAGRPHHDHLICTGCGKTVEFFLETIEALQRDVARLHGFTLTGHRHEIHGLCPKCQTRAAPAETADDRDN